jgi:hypothetical protein
MVYSVKVNLYEVRGKLSGKGNQGRYLRWASEIGIIHSGKSLISM